ncbi:Predicted dehydrogenase [Paenibacillus sp. yr247]|uniref:Gfo/Idh/MocA family protein n=1 Tax=Paenibacillus sp. yr247 TaxID=1761880 RepID=UPI00088092A1|nr:Gfo/Idh/MocA family oxidoreductase [Paenibacillus sp. yr247]SDO19570.1 Predicted dehydrogenase [Paenibacillus sp. yr247]
MSVLRGAVIGYGGAFNMGKQHAGQMIKNGISFVAACDLDAGRMEQAKQDFPEIRTFTDPTELISQNDIDLITVITPHNTHASLAKQILSAGKHCILEKPMCIFTKDAYEMVKLSQEKGKMLSVYHNRRWDGWYLTLKQLIEKEILGDIFHMEFCMGGYKSPGNWWRSNKEISGGALYDWGAHLVDYALGIIPGKIKSVRGFIHNRVWHEYSNEDHVDSIVQMENGAVIQIQISNIAFAGKPHIRVLGTKGGIIDANMFDGELTLFTEINGVKVETKVPCVKDQGDKYYENIAAHLYKGEELIVKPEQAMRNIAVIETTERSAAEGKELPVPHEDIVKSVG